MSGIKTTATIIPMPAPKDGKPADPRPNEVSMTVKKSSYPFQMPGVCAHINTVLDEELEQVTCRDCGVPLSMFWVLKRLATAETKWKTQRQEIEREIEILEDRKRCKCEKCGEITKINRNSPIR